MIPMLSLVRPTTAAIPFLMVSAAMSQGVVLPPPVQTQNPMPMVVGQLRTDFGMFPSDPVGGLVSRTQIVYAAADVASSSTVFNDLSIRAPEFVLNGVPGSTTPAYKADVTIVLANGALPPWLAVNDFDTNLGTQNVTVFQGQVTLPNVVTGAWPAAWELPIAFQQPFTFLGGTPGVEALVVDITVGNIQPSPNHIGFWAVEWTDVDNGSSDRLVAGCEFANDPGVRANAFSAGAVIGADFEVQYDSYPQNSPYLIDSLHLFGVELPSPVGLSLLGLTPSTFDCAVAVHPLALGGLNYVAQYGQMKMPTPLPIPNNQSLIGATFSTQPASLEVYGAGIAVQTGPAMRWTIGSGSGYIGSSLLHRLSTLGQPTTGQLRVGGSVSLRLN